MAKVHEQVEDLDGQPVFWLQADHDDVPTLYLHGVPTCSDDWLDFLPRTGGLAPDLPGFGRSGKRGDGDYAMDGYDHWIERFLDARGIDRFNLVVHDWGGVGLMTAQRFPERVRRLVVINSVPLLPGYRWHRMARAWRTPVVGETAMGMIWRPVLKQLSREFTAGRGPAPAFLIDRILRHFDPGTQRAILRLYRSADPPALAAAGAHLGDLACPALVVWGEQDPYVPARFADAYYAALPDAEQVRLPDAGHWPWIDRPDVVDTITAFLLA